MQKKWHFKGLGSFFFKQGEGQASLKKKKKITSKTVEFYLQDLFRGLGFASKGGPGTGRNTVV